MDYFIGIDIGTSGVRAVCADSAMITQATSAIQFKEISGLRTEPDTWARAVTKVLTEIVNTVPPESIRSVAVDGTSGTMIVTDPKANPLCEAMMYNDTCSDSDILAQIKQHAPSTSAAHGASSGLAKAIVLSNTNGASMIQHEADWVTSGLSGVTGLSDENNALKTGYDPLSRTWPEWIEKTGMNRAQLPTVYRAGQPIGLAKGWLAQQSGLPESALVVAGTTDGCASFLSTGASEPGDGVTVLGSTLTIKLLSLAPIYAPEFGIYSHRIGDTWLAGGASNTGGKVLEHYFSGAELTALSKTIAADSSTGLDYYPLLGTGERFPINDSTMQPRLEPRPASDALFLQAMLEGISAIENLAYTRLAELGGPQPRSIRTVGGGAKNGAWTRIRQKQMNDSKFEESLSVHVATGTAVLAKRGAMEAGMLH